MAHLKNKTNKPLIHVWNISNIFLFAKDLHHIKKITKANL